MHASPQHKADISNNCNQALSDHNPFTSAQNYFSLKYLEFFRGNTPITVRDITNGRHNLFIVLSIYIVISFCMSCAGKLQNIQRRDEDDMPHWT